MMAAERGGILMLAEIAMRQALAYSRPTPAPTPQKKRPRNIGLSDDRALAGGLDARTGFDHVRDWNDLDRLALAGAGLRSKFPDLPAELRIGGLQD
jgi:hypothetical protein